MGERRLGKSAKLIPEHSGAVGHRRSRLFVPTLFMLEAQSTFLSPHTHHHLPAPLKPRRPIVSSPVVARDNSNLGWQGWRRRINTTWLKSSKAKGRATGRRVKQDTKLARLGEREREAEAEREGVPGLGEKELRGTGSPGKEQVFCQRQRHYPQAWPSVWGKAKGRRLLAGRVKQVSPAQ